MKKSLLTIGIMLMAAMQLFAKPVPPNVAREVAIAFYENNTMSALKTHPDFTLAYTCTSSASQSGAALTTPVAYYYVFNADNTQGFVIVSADDAALPILGYATNGSIDASTMPSNVQKWMESYKNQIRYIIDHQLEATDAIKAQWQDLSNGRGMSKNGSGVEPLLKTQWNQSPYYNDLCPYDNGKNKLSVTGCVATAMAQVLKYWSWPEKGSGFHSYSHKSYGTLSANFGSTTYNWGSMPSSIKSANKEIATIMYHCGVAVNMEYSPESSGAFVIKKDGPNTTESALTEYFDYDSKTVQGLSRSDYTDSKWLSMMKNELDNNRPIIYDGFGTGGGHCFVTDGYDNNDYLHFNWGWAGYYDGYFEVSALNPGGVGTGGGTGGYNSGQQAVIGIKPNSNNGGGGGGGTGTSASISLNDYLTVDYSTIYYGQKFTVHCDVTNTGKDVFKGDYSAAVFDEDLNFVDFISTVPESKGLPANYHYTDGIDFTTTGLLSMLPGKYYVSLFYRETSGNWVSMSDNGGYTNLIAMEVINPADIELYANMSLKNGDIITAGNSLSIKMDVGNYSTSNFSGTFDLSLFGLDGKLVTTIETQDKMTLGSNQHYTNGITFKTGNLNTEPGTYLLALMYKPLGGDWHLVGSTYYQNPIKVIVKQAPILPDAYEENNSSASAYRFIPVFNGNNAKVSTKDANVHISTDYDYYKVHLDAGAKYTLHARIYDEGNPNGGDYTLDGLLSYSIDGSKWSDAYDDVIDGDIIMPNGGDIYFFVSPYFAGNTGNYQLSVNIEKEEIQNGIKPVVDGALKIYPNPVKDRLTIDLASALTYSAGVHVEDLNGKIVWSGILPQGKKEMQVNTSLLSKGMYMLVVDGKDGKLRQKFVVCE